MIVHVHLSGLIQGVTVHVHVYLVELKLSNNIDVLTRIDKLTLSATCKLI